MKVIDLLNKIANGEEVPKKIKYNLLEKNYQILVYDEEEQEYRYENDYNNFCTFPNHHLNDEVEIIEEKEICHKCHKYPAEYNQTYCEFCLGISKLEEKKIPEKIDQNNYEWKYIYSKKSNKEIIDNLNILRLKYNEIIDYLKSKGE